MLHPQDLPSYTGSTSSYFTTLFILVQYPFLEQLMTAIVACVCVCVCVCVLECEHGLAITVTEEGSLFRLESFLAQGSSCNEVTITLLSQLLTQVGEASKERILSNHKSESFHRHVPPQPFFDSQSFEEPL